MTIPEQPSSYEHEQHVLELIQNRIYLRTQLASVSFQLCQISQRYNQTINEIIALNDEIRALAGSDAITDIVCIGDIVLGSDDHAAPAALET